MEEGKQSVQAWVEVSLAKEVDDLARAEGLSNAEFVRKALKLYVQVVNKTGAKNEKRLVLSGRRIDGGALEVAVDAGVKKGGG